MQGPSRSLCRGHGEEAPLAGYTLEVVSAFLARDLTLYDRSYQFEIYDLVVLTIGDLKDRQLRLGSSTTLRRPAARAGSRSRRWSTAVGSSSGFHLSCPIREKVQVFREETNSAGQRRSLRDA